MSISGGNPHILIYPFPTSGHIIPLLDLTHRLLRRGLVVTVAVTSNNLPLLNPFLSSSQFRHLSLPSIQITEIQNSPNSGNRLIAMIRFCRDNHSPPLLDFLRSSSDPPVAIISDFFLGWTHHLASEVGIPRFVFSPSGAFAFSVFSATWRNKFTQNDAVEDSDSNSGTVVTFPDIPNSPSYPLWQINHVYRGPRDSDWEFFRDCQMGNTSSSGIIVNTFAGLESLYLDHLKKEYFGNDGVWAVGPVLPLDDAVNRGGSSSLESHGVLTWLDSRKQDSVVYICFGSRMWLTRTQMTALLTALEKSKVSFVLCDRQHNGSDDADAGVIPVAFGESVGGRGYVIKGWAPQVAIVKHAAVGAFVTHCGWNSVLEGISAGVVMLTWPMGADQYTNAKLLVDELGVGIRVGESTKKIPESGELARILDESVEENLEERKRAKILQEAAVKATMKGGSSDKDLDGLVARLNQLKQEV